MALSRDDIKKSDAADLRKRAEDRLREKNSNRATELTPEDNQRLLHELQVYQIELELQNEELRDAQAATEMALEKYTDLYDFAPVGYFTLDENSLVRDVNLTGAQFVGTERSRLKNTPLGFHFTRETISRFEQLFHSLTNGQSPASCDAVLKQDSRPVHLNAVETSSVAINGMRFRLAMTDITDLKNSEEQAKRYSDDLARSNKDLEQFAYVASHDLQEPLRMIAGFIELLDRKYHTVYDADGLELLSFILDGAKRMQALITDLLKFSRIGHEVDLDREVDLNEVLRGVLRASRARLDEVHARIQHENLPTVRGNSVLLAQVFENLLNNSIKFRSKEKHMLEIAITAAEGSHAWIVSIRDNGIGFPPEDAERVFDIFSRLHPQSKYGGTGIGLAICRRIIEQYGGRIWAKSEPGHGATFSFTLPAVK